MRPPALMSGPNATTATSAMSSPCKTRLRQAWPVSSSQHSPMSSSNGFCANLPKGSMPGRPTNEDFGTSINSDLRKTRQHRPFFAGASSSIRILPLATMDWPSPFSGTSGIIQRVLSRKFDAAVESLRQVVRLRPGYNQSKVLIAASLAHLGRIDEARELLEGARAQIVDPRFSQRAPWLRPEDYALRAEGLRLAIGQAPKP